MLSPYELYKSGLERRGLRWLIIILTIVYLFSPVDILPELIFNVFGLIDDGVLLSLLVASLVSISHEQKLKRKQAKEQLSNHSGQTIDVPDSSSNSNQSTN